MVLMPSFLADLQGYPVVMVGMLLTPRGALLAGRAEQERGEQGRGLQGAEAARQQQQCRCHAQQQAPVDALPARRFVRPARCQRVDDERA